MNLRVSPSESRPPGPDPTGTGWSRRRAGDTVASLQAAAADIRAASRYLIAQGFEPTDAGNLTAQLHGLAPVEGGWTVEELERLLFVRHLVKCRHLKS